MLVHFLKPLQPNANSIFFQELKKQPLNIVAITGAIRLPQGRRWQLIFWGWPRLLLFSLNYGVRTFRAPRPPDAIVATSHLECLGLLLAKTFTRSKRRTAIVLQGFIYTPRRSNWLNWMRKTYFEHLLPGLTRIVVHSHAEERELQRAFPAISEKFIYVPYGLHVFHEVLSATDDGYVLSAGRSFRDYDVLVRAFSELPYPLGIVCDSYSALPDKPYPSNVTILRNCHGQDYIDQLRRASLVVIPLSTKDLSAGQMLLLQAFAFAKPVIITRTRTIEDYLIPGQEALTVTQGDAAELKEAVNLLMNDEKRAKAMGEQGKRRYVERHSMAAFTARLASVLQSLP